MPDYALVTGALVIEYSSCENEVVGTDPNLFQLYPPPPPLPAFPITAVKQNVAGRSLAADFKLLTCF